MGIMFAFPGNEGLSAAIARHSRLELGFLNLHRFPDGECLLRLDSEVRGKDVVVTCSLDRPDAKALALMFFAKTAREFAAKSICLIAPYLGYMRQDKRFNPGEALSAVLFGEFLASHFDRLVTVDPHLHRNKDLGTVFSKPARLIHAADAIGEWISAQIPMPVVIGPDEESAQWVMEVAKKINAPYAVLSKRRRGDRQVELAIPDLSRFKNHTPVLLDDIISTAHTMIEATKLIIATLGSGPVCIGVHAVFAEDAYLALQQVGAKAIVTCNTIRHPSNHIDVSQLISRSLVEKLGTTKV